MTDNVSTVNPRHDQTLENPSVLVNKALGLQSSGSVNSLGALMLVHSIMKTMAEDTGIPCTLLQSALIHYRHVNR